MGSQRGVRWEFVRKILEAVHSCEGAEEVVDAFYVKMVGQMGRPNCSWRSLRFAGYVDEPSLKYPCWSDNIRTTTRDRGRV